MEYSESGEKRESICKVSLLILFAHSKCFIYSVLVEFIIYNCKITTIITKTLISQLVSSRQTKIKQAETQYRTWYLLGAPYMCKYGTWLFFCGKQAQDHSRHVPGSSKNALSPIGFPLTKKKKVPQAPGNPPERVRAWGTFLFFSFMEYFSLISVL